MRVVLEAEVKSRGAFYGLRMTLNSLDDPWMYLMKEFFIDALVRTVKELG